MHPDYQYNQYKQLVFDFKVLCDFIKCILVTSALSIIILYVFFGSISAIKNNYPDYLILSFLPLTHARFLIEMSLTIESL